MRAAFGKDDILQGGSVAADPLEAEQAGRARKAMRDRAEAAQGLRTAILDERGAAAFELGDVAPSAGGRPASNRPEYAYSSRGQRGRPCSWRGNSAEGPHFG